MTRAKELITQSMEGADGRIDLFTLKYILHPLFHFSCRLVGKSDGDDAISRNRLGTNQPGYAIDQHRSFSTPGTCGDQQRPIRCGDRLPLTRI